jgi:hypothetical protein
MTPSTCSCLRTRDDVDVDVAGRPLTSGVVGCRLADPTTRTLPLPVAARAARRPGATPTPASSDRPDGSRTAPTPASFGAVAASPSGRKRIARLPPVE